ncbi:MAG: NUDIX domain-containing protein [Leptospiraceae bacterium]|nr:NUDIX domain-containing protein [Leptospiraceae bacterium]
MEQFVRVGVSVFIKRENKILLGKRIGSHGAETWACPGGHIEFGETPIDTLKREVEEETGLSISNIQKLNFTNDIFTKENKHYITLFYTAESKTGEPQILEPHKCKEWKWFLPNDLPDPLFLPIENLLKEQKKLI